MKFETTNELSLKDSRNLGILCKLAYKKEEESEKQHKVRLADELSSHNINVFEKFSVGDIEGYICATDEVYIEVIRGTDEVIDWIRNIRVNQIDWVLGKVHSGFLDGAEGIWPTLKNLRKKYHKGQRIIVTGHSLGGAEATLIYAKHLFETDSVASQLVTFGSPRVGGIDFQEKYSKLVGDSVWRFENEADAVPQVPQPSIHYKSFKAKYCHIGNYIHLKSGKATIGKYNQVSGYIRIFFPLIWVLVKGLFAGKLANLNNIFSDYAQDRMQDHSMEAYINSIDKAILNRLKK